MKETQTNELIKDFLTKELDKPELAKKTAEEIEKDLDEIKIIKEILWRNIKTIIEKGERLDINNPKDIQKAKMLIAYQMIEYGDIQGFFPKKADEQINRASNIIKRKINEINFDKKQGETIVLENCISLNQRNQIISYEEEFTSGNSKFDQLLKQNTSLKRYLNLQVMGRNLQRLDSMTQEKGTGDKGGKFEKFREELWAKRESLWREESNLYQELFTDPSKAINFINLLSNLSIEEINSQGSYEIKLLLSRFLQNSGDNTFSYRDLEYNNGVDINYETGDITINKPYIEVDNMQIISTGIDGIKMKNKITGQATTVNENTFQKAKEIRDQSTLDEKHIEAKRKEIAKDLGIDINEEISQEDRNKIQNTLIINTFGKDQKLFEAIRRKSYRQNREGGEHINSEAGIIFNKILKEKGVNSIDCLKGRTTIEAKEINGNKAFVLDQGDIKVIIPFDGQPQVEQHKLSQQEISETIKETERSSNYIRAQYEIEHPRQANRINISGLGLSSKEVANLLSNPILQEIDNLEIDVSNNKISTFPQGLISMNNLKSLNLGGNFIKELPKENIDKEKCEKLESIYLNNNSITQIPREFLQLNHIKNLSISNNELSEIPSSINELSLLENLIISNNNIQKLPDNLTKIKTLKNLSFYGCTLENLPQDFNKLVNLQSLKIGQNKLTSVPDISTLIKLEDLDLSKNNLIELPPLGSLVELRTLSIENNKKLKIIPNDIKTLPKLESEIKLSNNINSGEEIKDRFIQGSMSRKGYKFPDGANKFFIDNKHYKFTFTQGSSESQALKNAQNDLNINKEDTIFTMQKKLANGNYSLVVFSAVNEDEYYERL